MSTYLCHSDIRGKTVQSTSYSTIYEFPSITLCSNIHLDAGRSIYINSTEFNVRQLIMILSGDTFGSSDSRIVLKQPDNPSPVDIVNGCPSILSILWGTGK